MNKERHPDSGKVFYIRLADSEPQAVFDACINGKQFTLLDWADRISLDSTVTKKDADLAKMFFLHRVAPHLSLESSTNFDFRGAVFGKHTFAFAGEVREELLILSETELSQT